MPLSDIRTIYEVNYLQPQKRPKSLNGVKHLYDEDLAFNGHQTQHSTHSLHPYVAAINPPLVKKLIDTYIPKGENVLDPYCGGGGVLVECLLSGRECAGGEINPLAVIISKAKTRYVSPTKIHDISNRIIERAHALEGKINLEFDKTTTFWFKEETLRELAALLEASKESAFLQEDIKPLFQTILSATIRDVMLTYRGEVRLRKLIPVDSKRFNPDVFKTFLKRSKIATERVATLPKDIVADVDLRDVRQLPFSDDQFYGIICSPPYADDTNGVGYFQFSRYMLNLLGLSFDEIKEYRKLFHGTEIEGKTPPNSPTLLESLEQVKKGSMNGKYGHAVAFYHDYQKGLKEMVRVTKRWIIIVIGNRVLARTAFDNTAITVDIMNSLGVDLKHHYTRELKKKRIANLGGDGGGINLEHILVFEK